MTRPGRPFWRSVLTYGAASVFLGSALHVGNLVWTHFLSPEDYGRFANLEIVFGFAAALFTFGQHQVHLVFVRKEPQALAERAGVFALSSVVLGSLAAASVLVVPAAWLARLLGSGVPRWALAGVLVAGGLAVGRQIAQGIAEGEGQAVRASLWKEAVDGARPLIAVPLFVLLGWTWEARWGGLVLAHAGAGALALLLLIRRGRVRAPGPETELRAALRFALPIVVSTVAYVAYDSADRLFLTAYQGLESVGRYHVAYKVALVAQTVNVVMLRSFNPLFYDAHHRGDTEAALALAKLTAMRTLGVVLLLAVALPAILWLVPILGADYEAALPVIPVVVLGLGFQGASAFWQAALYARSRSLSVLFIGLVTATANVALNAILVPRFAEMGAAVATLIAFVAMFLTTARLAHASTR